MTSSQTAREPIVGNATAGLAGLLKSLGISDSTTRGGVEDTVVDELAQRGFQARVKELRWGTLTLLARPQDATLLRFDQDNILAALAQLHPGVVRELRVHVDRD